MIHGSGRCAAVGIRSAMKTAVSPPLCTSTALVVRHVARREPHRDPGQHLDVAFQQLPAARRRDGLEVGRQVARPGALVGVAGELELAALHDVGGVGKPGRSAGAGRPSGSGSARVAAGMVEVQVGVDHPAHIAGGTRRSRARPPAGSRLESRVLDAVDVVELRVLLVAERRCPPARARRGARSGGSAWPAGSGAARRAAPLLPERARHHAEHRAAIQPLAGRPPACDSAASRPRTVWTRLTPAPRLRVSVRGSVGWPAASAACAPSAERRSPQVLIDRSPCRREAEQPRRAARRSPARRRAARCRAAFSKPGAGRGFEPAGADPRTNGAPAVRCRAVARRARGRARPHLGADEVPVEPRIVRDEYPPPQRGQDVVRQLGERGALRTMAS